MDYRSVPPKELVRASYNQISRAYRGDSISRDRSYFEWLEVLRPNLQPGSRVLDLGCGCGVPIAQELALTCQVTGVDISEVQIQRARDLVPSGTFICDDIATLEFAKDEFDAIVSFFTIIHVPVSEQRLMFQRMADWLKPGGYLMATVGYREWTGYKDSWYGAPMYWSHADEASYVAWLAENGFELLWRDFFPEGSDGHVILMARRTHPPAE